MSNSIYDDLEGIVKRSMTLFFLVDTSGSMSGSKIGAVNDAIRNVIPEIVDISKDNADARIKIAVLAFSSGASWLSPEPVDVENFTWSDMKAENKTDMGAAFKKLNEKLSKTGFMNDAGGSYAPVIILMSDGEPTDDYMTPLTLLHDTNKWFQSSLKFAIAIGDDANEEMLAKFTGSIEAVLKVHTPEALKNLIKFVSVTSSKIGSNSALTGGTNNTSNSVASTNKQSQLNMQMQNYATTLIDEDQDGW